MTYPLSNRLFLENGPAIHSAAARSRRAVAQAYFLAERAKLKAARTVNCAALRLAA